MTKWSKEHTILNHSKKDKFKTKMSIFKKCWVKIHLNLLQSNRRKKKMKIIYTRRQRFSLIHELTYLRFWKDKKGLWEIKILKNYDILKSFLKYTVLTIILIDYISKLRWRTITVYTLETSWEDSWVHMDHPLHKPIALHKLQRLVIIISFRQFSYSRSRHDRWSCPFALILER